MSARRCGDVKGGERNRAGKESAYPISNKISQNKKEKSCKRASGRMISRAEREKKFRRVGEAEHLENRVRNCAKKMMMKLGRKSVGRVTAQYSKGKYGNQG